MAYCGKCGKQIPDNAKFCDGCGAPVMGSHSNPGQDTNVNNGYGTSGESQQYGGSEYNTSHYEMPKHYNRSQFDRYNTPVIVNRIRSVGSSVLLLVLIICMAASVVFGLIAGGGSPLGMMAGNAGPLVVVTLIGCVPTILTLVGLLMFYLECRKTAAPLGSGVGIYKAGKIVSIIYYAIIGAVVVFGMLFGGAFLSGMGGMFGNVFGQMFSEAGMDASSLEYSYSAVRGVMTGVIVFIVIIVAVIVFLGILLQVKLMSGANTVRNSLHAGRRTGLFPVYPFVIEIILAIFVFISMINTIGTAGQYMSYFGGSGIGGILGLSVVNAIISVVQIILTIIMLYKFRAAVNQSN